MEKLFMVKNSKKKTADFIENILLIIAFLWIGNARHSLFSSSYSNDLTIMLGAALALYLLCSLGIRGFINTLKDYCIPMIIIVALSSVLAYFVNGIPIRGYIAPSIKRCMSYVASFVIAYYGVSRKHEKFPILLIISMAVSYATVFVKYICYGGFGILHSFMNNPVNGISLEIENTAAALLMLLVYFFYSKDYSHKTRMALMLTCVLIILFCNKRVLYFACIAAFAIIFVMRKISFIEDKEKLIIIGLLLVIVGVCYIWTIKNGYYIQFMKTIGISDSKRGRIWYYFVNDYEFSPFYCGKSIAYTDTILKDSQLNMTLLGKSQPVDLLLHNDLLRTYIGWGFILFVYYLLNILVIVPLKVMRLNGSDMAWRLFLITILMFFIMFFDNMFTQPIFNICFFTVALSAIGIEEKKTYQTDR